MKPEKSSPKKASKPAAKPSTKPVESTAKPAAKPAAPKAKKEAEPAIPPILLEDDKPAAPVAGGPGQRYSLGATPAPKHTDGATESLGELPEAYGTGKLILAARDPHWLYARWDLTSQQQRKYNSLSVDRHLVVRVYRNEISGKPVSIIHVHPESNHWFIHVEEAGAKYLAELGYYTATGAWVGISTSGATMVPPDKMSDDFEALFASIPTDISLPRLLEIARAAVLQNIPLAEVIAQLRASGFQIPEETALPGEKWTPERERALASIISMDQVRRVWMGSVEITELIRRQLQQETSSMAAAQFSVPGSELGGLSSITSVSSPFGAESGRKKGFWFNVNAELIIYGATEPDAEVSIGGRVIKLRPDGTFSYRFILPDGNYELPAVAVSNDKSDSRAAELKFMRSTKYHGDVGQHPQDPKMKPPLVENVS